MSLLPQHERPDLGRVRRDPHQDLVLCLSNGVYRPDSRKLRHSRARNGVVGHAGKPQPRARTEPLNPYNAIDEIGRDGQSLEGIHYAASPFEGVSLPQNTPNFHHWLRGYMSRNVHGKLGGTSEPPGLDKSNLTYRGNAIRYPNVLMCHFGLPSGTLSLKNGTHEFPQRHPIIAYACTIHRLYSLATIDGPHVLNWSADLQRRACGRRFAPQTTGAGRSLSCCSTHHQHAAETHTQASAHASHTTSQTSTMCASVRHERKVPVSVGRNIHLPGTRHPRSADIRSMGGQYE